MRGCELVGAGERLRGVRNRLTARSTGCVEWMERLRGSGRASEREREREERARERERERERRRQAADGHAYLEAGKSTGKVLYKIA